MELSKCLTLFAFAMAASANPVARYVVLSPFQGPGSTTAVVRAVETAGGRVTKNFERIGVIVAESDSPAFMKSVLASGTAASIAEDVEVQWIKPIAVEAPSIEPGPEDVNSEPFWAYQWNIRQIGADQTAAAGYRGFGARVAVLDSGIITTCPDIAPNLNIGLSRSLVPAEPNLDPPPSTFNHGTHVAGIIAAAINNRGIQGVAPLAEIVAVKVLSATTGSGSFSWIIEGILYASGPDVHADVINMSLGASFDRVNAGGGGAGPLISALGRAINSATAAGTLVVSAAGNDGLDLNSGRAWSIPAQSGNGMAVSAVGPRGLTAFDTFASYSNYGQSVIDVAAPGGDFVVAQTYPFDMVIGPGAWSYDRTTGRTVYSYYFAAGTSMAAPHVSGVAALLVGRYGHMAPSRLKSLIEHSAVDLYKPGADPQSGNGRIDAAKALQLQ